MKKILVLIVLVGFLFPFQAFGHSGGTDRWGCHHDHKRGGYHCHGKKWSKPKQDKKEVGKIKDEKVDVRTKVKIIKIKSK